MNAPALKPGTRVVYKYEWPLRAERADRATFDMPRDAEILCVREQYDRALCIWARVVIGRALEKRNFILCGTGHEAPDPDHTYIGTGMLHGGSLVLHVFEVPRDNLSAPQQGSERS